MNLLSRLFGRDTIEPTPYPTTQEILICLKLSNEQIGTARERQAIATLQDRLIRAVQARGAGEFEDLEFAEGFGTLSFTGPSADGLAEAVLPMTRTHDSRRGSYLLKRYGEAGVREQSIVLSVSH
jgi:hypothetical protein